MWNWLVSALASGATIVLYDGSPFHPGRTALFDLADEEGSRCSASRPSSSTRWPRPACGPSTRTASRAAHDLLHRLAAVARGLRVRVRARQGRRAPGVDLGRHRPVRLLRRRRPDRPGVRGRDPGPGARHGRRRVATTATAAGRAGAGELVCTAPFPSMPLGFWGDDPPAGSAATAPRTSSGSRACGPRRLRLVDRARRHGHPRPQRRHAQPGRRAHRHRRDLPAGRARCPRWSRRSPFGQQWDGDIRIVLLVRLADGVTLDRRARRDDPARIRTELLAPPRARRHRRGRRPARAPAAASWSSWPWPTP